MITTIMKDFFTLLSSIYLYHKLLNLPVFPKKHIIDTLLFIAVSCTTSCFLDVYFPLLQIPFFVIGLATFIHFTAHILFRITLTASILSIAISYIIYTISSFIIILIFYPFSETIPYFEILILICNGILQYALAHLPFCFKRLQKGMPFLFKSNSAYIGIVVSSAILLCITFINNTKFVNLFVIVCFFIAVILCAALFFFWWQNRITQSYLSKLRQAEIASYQKEINEQNKYIQLLLKNNDELAGIIHKDNKLIPAMEYAVLDLIENKNHLSPEQLHCQCQDLLSQLQALSDDRKTMLNNYHHDEKSIPRTGIHALDGLLRLINQKAFDSKIHFHVSVPDNLRFEIEPVISITDLSHLTGDLLENALIAAKQIPDGSVSIRFGTYQKSYVIEVSEKAALFEPSVLHNFGLTPHTTHADTGGSGIGLMDIWKIKQKYKASLHIHEYNPNNHNITTKIRICFDKKNHYIIQSYRYTILLSQQTRSDLVILPDD